MASSEYLEPSLKKKPKTKTWCSAVNCSKNKSSNPELSFFRFPSDPARSKEWVNLCRRLDLMDKTKKYWYNNCKLCSDHFEDCMFYNDLRNRLKSDAKPTLFEIPNPPPTISSIRRPLQREQTLTAPPEVLNVQTDTILTASTSSQTTDEISSNTPRKMKQKQAIKAQKQKIKRLISSLGKAQKGKHARQEKALDEAPANLANFVRMQIKLHGKKKRGRRMPNKTGISQGSLKIIENKVMQMNLREKECTLCMDEISLKTNLFSCVPVGKIVGLEDFGGGYRTNKVATSAFVLLIRSISGNWKQPLAYYLVNGGCPTDTMEDIVKEAIDKLECIGLNVVVVMSAQGSNFYSLATRLKVTPDEPWFMHNGWKIFFIFDPPHLIKSVRNNFMKYSLRFGEHGKILKQYMYRFSTAHTIGSKID
ncbi:THAP domain-containing [Paramuricea clavata]|uniref:THAP domain-containing, partial n=1 Tax=Paramuricea clavata TaxID=317549 RepID=A0A7D9LGE3_PARCT|nr:THAP domain-containing [Paramuricea clavata]